MSTTTTSISNGLIEEDKRQLEDIVCHNQFPKNSFYYAELDAVTYVFTALTVTCTIASVITFAFQARLIRDRVNSDHRIQLLTQLVGIFPVTSLCASIAVVMPATLDLMRIFISAYLASSLTSFVGLVRHLFDGRRKMWVRLRQARVRLSLAVTPCCCFRNICRPHKPTPGGVRVITFLIYQAAWLQSLLALLVFIAFVSGYNVGVFSTSTDVIRILSTVVATMACFVFADCTDRVLNPNYRIKHILAFVKVILLIINLQTAFLGLFADAGIIPRTSILSSRGTAEPYPNQGWARADGYPLGQTVWNDVALSVEMLALQLLACAVLAPDKCALFDRAPGTVTMEHSLASSRSSYGSLADTESAPLLTDRTRMATDDLVQEMERLAPTSGGGDGGGTFDISGGEDTDGEKARKAERAQQLNEKLGWVDP